MGLILAVAMPLMAMEKHTVNVNAQDNRDRTALMLMVQENDHQGVKNLLANRSILLNLVDNEGNAALHYAVKYDRLRIIQSLLEAGAHLLVGNKNKIIPLVLAIQLGRERLIPHLIKYSRHCIDNIDLYGRSPLHWAIYKGSDMAAWQLLDAGADCFLKTATGETPLMLAAKKNLLSIASMIIIRKEGTVHERDDAGWTPLMYSIQGGANSVLNLLYGYDKDINATNCGGYTALHLASLMGYCCGVSSLLQHGADVNLKLPDGQTPLMLGVISGNFDVVTAILEYDPQLNHRDAYGRTAIMFARKQCIFQQLQQVGCEFTKRDRRHLLKELKKRIQAKSIDSLELIGLTRLKKYVKSLEIA